METLPKPDIVATIASVWGSLDYSNKVRNVGNGWEGHFSCPSPHHDDSTPSFVVHRADNRFHCFGCGIKGDSWDVLSISMTGDNVNGNFPAVIDEAVRLGLVVRLGDELYKLGKTAEPTPVKASPAKQSVAMDKQFALKQLKSWQNLLRAQGMRIYIQHGLSYTSMEHFGVGYTGNVVTGGVPTDSIAYPHFIRGELRGIKFRKVDLNVPKEDRFRAYEGGRFTIYNGDALLADDKRYIILTEGEKDVITLHSHYLNAVAIPAAGWKDDYASYFSAFEKVFIFADNDPAGWRAANERHEALSNSTIVNIPHIIISGRKAANDFADFNWYCKIPTRIGMLYNWFDTVGLAPYRAIPART